MKKIFIGVDGGGTKTKILIEDEKGNFLAQARGGPANIRLCVTQAWQSIFTALKEALKLSKISLTDPHYEFHIGMGLAGTEVPSACENFLKKDHPFKTLVLKSDAYAACVGAHAGKDGAIVIIGTGVVGFQIYKNTQSQVNGWGFPHGDEGGGAWLGLEAVRRTLQSLDKRQDSTPLTQAIFQQFNENLSELVTWANQATSSHFAQLAPLVLQFLEQKDPFALELLKESAKEITKVLQALHTLQTDIEAPLPIAFFGGIAPFIRPFLEKNTHIVERKYDATKGALMMLKQECL